MAAKEGLEVQLATKEGKRAPQAFLKFRGERALFHQRAREGERGEEEGWEKRRNGRAHEIWSWWVGRPVVTWKDGLFSKEPSFCIFYFIFPIAIGSGSRVGIGLSRTCGLKANFVSNDRSM